MIRRQTFKFFALFLALGLLTVACGDDDDGVMERPDYTSIRYDVEVSDEFLAMYEVMIEYKTLSGELVETRSDNLAWQYKEKQDGTRPIDFSIRVWAKARDRVPNLVGDKKDQIYLMADVSMEYYTKKTSAKRKHQKPIDKKIDKAEVGKYMEAHPTIDLVSFTTQQEEE